MFLHVVVVDGNGRVHVEQPRRVVSAGINQVRGRVGTRVSRRRLWTAVVWSEQMREAFRG